MQSIVKAWAEAITGLHKKWTPHEGQKPIIDSIFVDGCTSLFLRCGRKYGKTDVGAYLLWRIAKSFPGMPCYYFASQQNQARILAWDDPRIPAFGPREWLLPGSRGINNSEMLLRFTNGSTIKLDGTENFDKYRGTRYKLAVYDEYKDCDPRMRRAMRPNAAVYGGIDIYMGSPPEVAGTDYETLDKEHEREQGMRSFHAPTTVNPHISKQWIFNEKRLLYTRGEGDVFEREYNAKYIRGGASAIFPMLDKKMVRPHAEIMQEIYRDRKKLQWFWWADPAGATCFGILFVAINPFNKRVYVLDEIYEKDQKEMTVQRIGRRIIQKRDELYERAKAWRGGYGEAATWFLNEWIDNFEEEDGLEPTNKASNDKSDGLSLIKDIMLNNLLIISDRAKNFYIELESYQKDKNGNIPKKDDHLIDDFRYILGAAYYELKKENEYKEEHDENFRAEKLSDVIKEDDLYKLR